MCAQPMEAPRSGGAKSPATSAAVGVYDGWRLSMHEAMAMYQAFSGMKPIGPHRGMVSRVLGPLNVVCETCVGQSILTDAADDP